MCLPVLASRIPKLNTVNRKLLFINSKLENNEMKATLSHTRVHVTARGLNNINFENSQNSSKVIECGCINQFRNYVIRSSSDFWNFVFSSGWGALSRLLDLSRNATWFSSRRFCSSRSSRSGTTSTWTTRGSRSWLRSWRGEMCTISFLDHLDDSYAPILGQVSQ